MIRPTCQTCPFWDVVMFPNNGDETYPQEWQDINPEDITAESDVSWRGETEFGECRRRPPEGDEIEGTSEFPVTGYYQWCGEHPDFPAYAAEFARERAAQGHGVQPEML